MLIAIGILVIWIISGILAVGLAGFIDKIDDDYRYKSAPVLGLFYFGTLGLLVSLVFGCVTIGTLLKKKLSSDKLNNVIMKIYDLGYGKNEKN